MNALVSFKKSGYALMQEFGSEVEQDYLAKNPEVLLSKKLADEENAQALEHVVATLDRAGISHTVAYRAEPTIHNLVRDADLVIAVGGDGTALDVARYITDGTPLLGVNSNPNRSVGFYCSETIRTLENSLAKLDTLPRTIFPRLQLYLDGVLHSEPILNDVLVGKSLGSQIVYDFSLNGVLCGREKSDSVLVSTAGGSSAWMYNEGGVMMELTDSRMQFMQLGKRNRKTGFADVLELYSHTHNGVLKMDGDYRTLPFSWGSRIRIEPAAPITIIGEFSKKRSAYVAHPISVERISD